MVFLQLWRAGTTFCCGAQASHCSGFLCCRAHGLQCHTQARWWKACGLQSMRSVVVVHGLSFSETCGIFSDQGSNPCALRWQVNSYLLYHQGCPQWFFAEMEESILKFILNFKGLRMAETILQKNKFGGHTFLGFKMYCKATVLKRVLLA